MIKVKINNAPSQVASCCTRTAYLVPVFARLPVCVCF